MLKIFVACFWQEGGYYCQEEHRIALLKQTRDQKPKIYKKRLPRLLFA